MVSVSGELDATTASTLEGTLLTLPDHTAQAVIVDLARCEFIDLRGLHVLLAARKRLERSNRQLELVCGNPHLLRVFKVTRCDGLFQIWPSLTVAAEAADMVDWRTCESEKQARCREQNESASGERIPDRA